MKRFKRIAAAVTLIAALMSSLAMTGCDEKKETASQAVDELEPTEAVTEAPEEEFPDIENFSAEPMGMLGQARSLRTINDDVVGYIEIDGTYVDYPVTQCEDNVGYILTDLYGNYLDSGTIFMDFKDIFVPDESKQSNNIVLYGHNMLNGTKFASLHKYRTDESTYEKSPIIKFNSNYVENEYVIFAYFLTSGSRGDSAYGEEFIYWEMQNMDEKEFNEYLETCEERSLISPDIDVAYGDQLITLQTCHLDEDNSRFLVIGRKLREGEKAEDFIKKADAEDKEKEEDADDSEESEAGEE